MLHSTAPALMGHCRSDAARRVLLAIFASRHEGISSLLAEVQRSKRHAPSKAPKRRQTSSQKALLTQCDACHPTQVPVTCYASNDSVEPNANDSTYHSFLAFDSPPNQLCLFYPYRDLPSVDQRALLSSSRSSDHHVLVMWENLCRVYLGDFFYLPYSIPREDL
jgi:hypothetical protein